MKEGNKEGRPVEMKEGTKERRPKRRKGRREGGRMAENERNKRRM